MIAIEKIVIPEGRRRLDQSKVEELAKSIDQIGLLNPITTTTDLVLIAGAHRIAACKSLGWTKIEVNMLAMGDDLIYELAEIDENLCRNELTVSKRSRAYLQRKKIYLKLHPETGHGGDRKARKQEPKSGSCSPPSFVADTAAKTGKSPSAIKEAVKLAEDVAHEVDAVIASTPVEDNASALKRIAAAGPEPEKQVEAAKREVEKAAAPKPKKQRDLHPKAEAKEPQASPPAQPRWSFSVRRDGEPAFTFEHQGTWNEAVKALSARGKVGG